MSMPRVRTTVDPGNNEVHLAFEPNPDTWAYVGKNRDELRLELTKEVNRWLEEQPLDGQFDEEMLQRLRSRVLMNLLAWVSQGWVKIP